MKETFRLRVNGQNQRVDAFPETPLLYVLRNQLELNGPKFGCGLQQCGACMILLNGKAVPSCGIPVSAMNDQEITTLEGLTARDGTLHPVQQAFIDQQAAQCGFCLNGMVISAVSLLEAEDKPDLEQIREGLQRNICRCGTHSRIVKAVKQSASS